MVAYKNVILKQVTRPLNPVLYFPSNYKKSLFKVIFPIKDIPLLFLSEYKIVFVSPLPRYQHHKHIEVVMFALRERRPLRLSRIKKKKGH